MKKLLWIVILGLFLQGCEDASVNKAKYFKNCVKDKMKVQKVSEESAVKSCQKLSKAVKLISITLKVQKRLIIMKAKYIQNQNNNEIINHSPPET